MADPEGSEGVEPDREPDLERINAIVEQFIMRHQDGESVDLTAFCEQQPLHLHESIRRRCEDYLRLARVLAAAVAESGGGDSPHEGDLGDFRIIREIGRGGMGATVYLAWQHTLQREVALKVLPAAVSQHPRQRERFARELQLFQIQVQLEFLPFVQ